MDPPKLAMTYIVFTCNLPLAVVVLYLYRDLARWPVICQKTVIYIFEYKIIVCVQKHSQSKCSVFVLKSGFNFFYATSIPSFSFSRDAGSSSQGPL